MKISQEQRKRIFSISFKVVKVGFWIILFSWVGYWIVQAIRHNKLRPMANRKYDLSPSTYLTDLSHSFSNLQTKVLRIRHSTEENEKLRLENMNLKLNLENARYDCNAKAAKANTKEFELKLSRETGAKVGRSLSGINYQAPPQLFPSQLYTLALAYIVAREDEKAVVLLTLLTGQEGNSIYKTAKNLLMTGVAWYRIENFSLADYYFDEVLKMSENENSIQSQAQARLWKALVAEKLQKRFKSQYWLKELVNHHPNSMESKWINRVEKKHESAN
jgi:leucyl aminopeptidase